jgi:RNA polymerase sigma-70 factor, ECF subfamily
MNLVSGLKKEKIKPVDDISLAQKGDKAAFARLIELNETSLCRIASSILNNEEDVKDAYQETILKAYKGVVRLKEREYFKTWLIRIMINECSIILRSRKRTSYLEDTAKENLEDASNVEGEVVRSCERNELWKALNSLEEELRLVTVLYYFEDLLQSDIAAVLNIPHGTVKSRISRAKEKLRKLLEIKL